MMNGGSGLVTMASNGVPIANLVNQLSMQLGEQVIDQTGLKGTYQYRLQFAAQGGLGLDGMPLPPAAESPESTAPSVFTALQEQLGLKLESTKGPVETITIDHIEEPSPN
jgi:bla regulator protein blaR1